MTSDIWVAIGIVVLGVAGFGVVLNRAIGGISREFDRIEAEFRAIFAERAHVFAQLAEHEACLNDLESKLSVLIEQDSPDPS